MTDEDFIAAMKQGIPPLPKPEGPPPGMEVIALGNAEIGIGTFEGQPATADGHAAPLPEYPQRTDLPPTPTQFRPVPNPFEEDR